MNGHVIPDYTQYIHSHIITRWMLCLMRMRSTVDCTVDCRVWGESELYGDNGNHPTGNVWGTFLSDEEMRRRRRRRKTREELGMLCSTVHCDPSRPARALRTLHPGPGEDTHKAEQFRLEMRRAAPESSLSSHLLASCCTVQLQLIGSDGNV